MPGRPGRRRATRATSSCHPQRHRGGVVVWRRVAAEPVDRGEDRVDDLACGFSSRLRDDLQQPLGAELAAERVVRFEDAVGAEDEQIAGGQIERDLVVGRSGKRSERYAGQLDLAY